MILFVNREKDLTSIWLNGKSSDRCPERRKSCLEEEAQRGEGLNVSWESSIFAKYSRY